jgi:uncharacterized membrane protein
VEVPDLQFRRFARLDLALLCGWIIGTSIQTCLWIFPPAKSGDFAPVVTILTSSSIYGLLALWLVLARRLSSKTPTTLV